MSRLMSRTALRHLRLVGPLTVAATLGIGSLPALAQSADWVKTALSEQLLHPQSLQNDFNANIQSMSAGVHAFTLARITALSTFNDPNDAVALTKLADLFPGRKIIGIACLDLVLGLGTLHCMTQQEPQ